MEAHKQNALANDANNFQHLKLSRGFGIIDDNFPSHWKRISALKLHTGILVKKVFISKAVRLWNAADV